MDRATHLADGLVGAKLTVLGVDAKPYRRSPYAPFRTTTLQQEAGRKLGFTAARTMQVAQRLYENGHITYMRTDSTTLSSTAVSAARAQVRELYGDSYLPGQAQGLCQQGQERAGGARGDPPGRRRVPDAGRRAGCAARSSASTS